MMRAAAALIALAALTSPAFAQSQADFVKAFAGKWQVYDPQMAAGAGLCQFELSGTATNGSMPITVTNCAAPLSTTASWTIQGSQLVLADAQGKPVVKLGGNQKRITGTTDTGLPVILERTGGDGTASVLEADYNASGCYYLGYSQHCAPKSELGRPAPAPDGQTKIQIGVNLNAHAEPRSDADTVGVVHQNTCVAVDACVMASDGPWCRAKFGDTTGWLRKFAIRQNRWPIVTFANSCS